jgi:hypothetical protein
MKFGDSLRMHPWIFWFGIMPYQNQHGEEMGLEDSLRLPRGTGLRKHKHYLIPTRLYKNTLAG